MRHNMGQSKTRGVKSVAATGAMIVAMAGLAGCSEADVPDAGEMSNEELAELEGEVGALEDRMGELEQDLGAVAEDSMGEVEEGLGAAQGAMGELEERLGAAVDGELPDVVGQEFTINAQASEVITSTDEGSAFTIAGEVGPALPVVSATAPEGLEPDDAVRISGSVQMVDRDSFEQDFGISEDALDDPDAFFDEYEGLPAIAAGEVELR